MLQPIDRNRQFNGMLVPSDGFANTFHQPSSGYVDVVAGSIHV